MFSFCIRSNWKIAAILTSFWLYLRNELAHKHDSFPGFGRILMSECLLRLEGAGSKQTVLSAGESWIRMDLQQLASVLIRGDGSRGSSTRVETTTTGMAGGSN